MPARGPLDVDALLARTGQARGACRRGSTTRADEMAALVEELVAVDTENPPGRGLGRCGRLLRDAMERLGLAPELIELPRRGARGAVRPARQRRRGRADRLLPRALRRRARAVAASSSRRDGPAAASSGAARADMKGGLVSMLYGAAAARELGLLGDGRIVLHLVCDEETGSVTGSGHLRERRA